ncbi:MAG TPA: oligopeptidase B, partial [Acidimicrobiia bacterium]|nr:oligopeptidase B [Acidimicrobiia bacterium]
MSNTPQPPVASRRPHSLRAHGDERVDDWYWLRDRTDPDVIAYLDAENAYTAAALAPTEPLRQEIYDEIVARVQETDVSAPAHRGEWDYFVRTEERRQYAIHGRRPRGAPEGVDESILFDENVAAQGHGYFSLGSAAVSPNQELLAYAVDHVGDERFELRVRDLAAGADLSDVVADTYYGLAWANDNSTLFYVRPDDATRPHQVWRHTIGSPVATDVLVFEDPDEHFF